MALKRTLTGAWKGLAKASPLRGPSCPVAAPRARFLSALHPLKPGQHGRRRTRPRQVVAGSVLVGFGLVLAFAQHEVAYADAPAVNYIRLAEVKKHGQTAERKWIIRGTQVYDITDWIPGHPGGDVVRLPRYHLCPLDLLQRVYDTHGRTHAPLPCVTCIHLTLPTDPTGSRLLN
jgi:Cytochrome b5-like Heme/Steroid binding domain